SEFIPISEATGLIEEIGAWVIGEACRQAKTWVDEGNPTRVSVNLSARQLADPALMHTIDAALSKYGLGPESLAVELTENVLSTDPVPKMEALDAFSDRGIEVAIDDFGIGYSSLSSLKVLPVDVVKIDRSFISGIGRSGDDYAVVATMIKLAQTLRKRVVAEGVETEEQLELLRDLGCDMAQGFLFSPAVFELDHGSTDTGWSALVLEGRR
ncbi:MAG: EAL domain-containing protein, partial [Acidimicrobiales bacterium]